jgi:hypothetical protein
LQLCPVRILAFDLNQENPLLNAGLDDTGGIGRARLVLWRSPDAIGLIRLIIRDDLLAIETAREIDDDQGQQEKTRQNNSSLHELTLFLGFLNSATIRLTDPESLSGHAFTGISVRDLFVVVRCRGIDRSDFANRFSPRAKSVPRVIVHAKAVVVCVIRTSLRSIRRDSESEARTSEANRVIADPFDTATGHTSSSLALVVAWLGIPRNHRALIDDTEITDARRSNLHNALDRRIFSKTKIPGILIKVRGKSQDGKDKIDAL